MYESFTNEVLRSEDLEYIPVRKLCISIAKAISLIQWIKKFTELNTSDYK